MVTRTRPIVVRLGSTQIVVLNVVESNRNVENCMAAAESRLRLFAVDIVFDWSFSEVKARPAIRDRLVLLVKIGRTARAPPSVVRKSICCSELERKFAIAPPY